jgi:uncharacterized protein (UPF0297 family)
MESNTTNLFNVDEFNSAVILETLKDVYEALEEKGYNPINQLVGYLISGDPGYISSYKEARTKISKIDRTKILEVIVKNYMEQIK